MHPRGNAETILPTAEAAEYLSRQSQTLRKWRLSGVGPRYIRMGRGLRARVGYRLSDLEAWLEARTFDSTSQETIARNQA